MDVNVRSCDIDIRVNIFKQRYHQDDVYLCLYYHANLGENHVARGHLDYI